MCNKFMNQGGFLQLILIVVVVAIIVIAGGGVLYYQQSAERNNESVQETQTVPESSSGEPSPVPTEQPKQQVKESSDSERESEKSQEPAIQVPPPAPHVTTPPPPTSPITQPPPAPTLINGQTLQERLAEAYDRLHTRGSGEHIRKSFLDIELVYTDDAVGMPFPREIIPFRYYYSREADTTFNICNIDLTVFICKGKLDKLIRQGDLDSGRCEMTPIYGDPRL